MILNRDRWLRRWVPSVASASRRRWLMWPLDMVDRLACWPWPEARRLPPNRMRLRVGVGNRLLFNAMHYRYHAVDFWMYALAQGLIRADSRILDLGCGCGRFATVLRRLNYKGWRFEGQYTGVDVDREMIDWCDRHFPRRRFRFVHVDQQSSVYNPGGTSDDTTRRLPLPDGGFDFVFSTSLFTHLLEAEAIAYLRETHRLLRPGGRMLMTVFCIDSFRERNWLGDRFTFEHRIGPAYVEDPRRPEAAVAFERQWLEGQCAAAGLVDATISGQTMQQDLMAHRPL